MKLEGLYSIINNRIRNKPKKSYVVSFTNKGEDAILQKIGEEAVEVIIAGKGKSKQRIIEEISDLYFMTLIFLANNKIPLVKIFEELQKRHKGEKVNYR